MNTNDPFLAEKIVQHLAAIDHRQATTVTPLARALNVRVEALVPALAQLRAEGLVEQTSGGAYSATSLGRQRATEALSAEMDQGMQEDTDALVASMAPAMAVDPDEVAWYESSLLAEKEAITAAFYEENGHVVRAALVASMNQMAPSAALVGWVASARHALEDHRANPSLKTALRARTMLRRAIWAYDPAALAGLSEPAGLVASYDPVIDGRRPDPRPAARVASAVARQARAARRTKAAPEPQQHEECCDGLCGQPGLTGKDFRR